MIPDDVQDLADMGCRRGKALGGRGMKGYMEMDAPLVRAGGGGDGRRKGLVEVPMPKELTRGASFDDLVEIHGVHESPEGLARGARGAHGEGVGEMNLADKDAGRAEPVQGPGRGLEFHGEVAAVVVDPKERVDAGVVGPVGAHAIEEGHGLGGGFEVAAGLGFEAKVQGSAGAAGEVVQEIDELPQVRARNGLGAVVEMEALP